MILQNNTATHLQPALLPFKCSTAFPVKPGFYKCNIQVTHGNILFKHGAYNLETGAWEDQPDNHEPDHILIHEGETKELTFTCKNHDGQADNIWIYNDSYLKPADFICSYERANESF